MLGSAKIVAFVPVTNVTNARAFYEGVLGLGFVSEDKFALVLDANGVMVRVTPVPAPFRPQPFTVLGWQVANIEEAVSTLAQKGVKFEVYGFPGQDVRGIWSAPGGTKVAWFKDPEGNLLGVSQHS